MERTAWRRAVAAFATVSLVASAVVLTTGDPNPGRARSAGVDAAFVNPAPDAIEHKAAVQNRQTQLTQRIERSTAKLHPALFIMTQLTGLLLVAAAGWFSWRAPSARPALERRRHTQSLRGPPLFQLA